MEIAMKKEGRTNRQAFDQVERKSKVCFSSQGFGRIVRFKQNLNADLMCDIYKRGLVPTARKQFGLDSTI